ncbi:MAG: trigger factor [Janthinobacterium lividum]
MDITQTKSEGLIREFDIVVSPADIEKNIIQKLKQVGQSAKIPGFRPGKIPLPVLKQRYESNVQQEVFEDIVKDAKRQLIDEQKLRVALEPKIELDRANFNQNEPLKIKMTLETLPEVEKIDLKKFDFEQLIAEVQDEEVIKALETLHQRNAELEDRPEGTIAQKSDTVHIAFKGTLASGKPIVGGSSDGMDLELGSGSFIPGFEDHLIGLKEGDHKEFDIMFPADYQAKDLAGQQTHFAVDIKKVKQKASPELTDDFAKQLGRDSLDELKKTMSELLASDYKAMSMLDAKRKILDKFAETFNFDIPQGLKELEFESIWNQVKQEEKNNPSQTDNQVQESDEENKKQYQDIAERRVRLGLVLAEIGREHNILVSQKELEQALMQEARKYPGMEQKVVDYYRNNPNAQASLRAPIFEHKVIEFILKEANTTQTKISYTDLKKRVDEITDGEEA